MTLPIISFLDNPRAGVEIDKALASCGFLQLTHIGIDADLLDAVFRASQAFFDGPAEIRHRSAYGSASENFGYQGVMEENLDPQAPADLKQSFTMRNIIARPPAEDRWPSAAFRDLMQRTASNRRLPRRWAWSGTISRGPMAARMSRYGCSIIPAAAFRTPNRRRWVRVPTPTTASSLCCSSATWADCR